MCGDACPHNCCKYAIVLAGRGSRIATCAPARLPARAQARAPARAQAPHTPRTPAHPAGQAGTRVRDTAPDGARRRWMSHIARASILSPSQNELKDEEGSECVLPTGMHGLIAEVLFQSITSESACSSSTPRGAGVLRASLRLAAYLGPARR